MSVVLAFDPGSTSSGWAELEVFGSPMTARLRAFGEVPHNPHAWRALIGGSHVVAIERVRGIVYGIKGAGIVPHLIDASWACGGIYATAKLAGIPVVDMPAVEWRRIVCGRPNASDAIVKLAVTRLVKDMPVRTNTHVRDAIGCGLAVGWTWKKARVA